MPGTLVLVRHGETSGNAANQFTGLLDPGLTAAGLSEAARVGALLCRSGIIPDRCYTSALLRTRQTLDALIAEMAIEAPPTTASPALNERDYGMLSGLNRDEARSRWGVQQVEAWRRGYSDVPPGGESLEQTAERVIAYYDSEIVPHLLVGQTVLIIGHGNSLRVLTMAIEGLTPTEAASRDLATGEPRIYDRLGQSGRIDEVAHATALRVGQAS